MLSSLYVSTQTALPDWVRARGLSIFLTVFFGAMSGGSLLWGQIASLTSIPVALLVAAAGAVLMIPLVQRARLGLGAELDLAPSGHWPEPLVSPSDAQDRGPVMIQVAYEIEAADVAAFRALMARMARARRRGGAYGWTLMQDGERPGLFVETWFEASWLQHMRHHERVSGEDRDVQEKLRILHRGADAPRVRHFLGAAGDGESP